MRDDLRPWRDEADGAGSHSWDTTLATARRRLIELGITVPEPFDLAAFSETVADCLGIRIKLVPTEMSALGGKSCFGATVVVRETHYVFYVVGMSLMHGLHNGVHELGHIIFDHSGVHGRTGAEAEADAVATVVLSSCEPPRRSRIPPAHLRQATARLGRAWD